MTITYKIRSVHTTDRAADRSLTTTKRIDAIRFGVETFPHRYRFQIEDLVDTNHDRTSIEVGDCTLYCHTHL